MFGHKHFPRLYHASPVKFKVGDVVEPRTIRSGDFAAEDGPRTHLTDVEAIHYTLKERIDGEVYYLYEVATENDLEIDACWDAVMTASPALVIGIVGTSNDLPIGPDGFEEVGSWWIDRTRNRLNIE